jgi:hypothetical protein
MLCLIFAVFTVAMVSAQVAATASRAFAQVLPAALTQPAGSGASAPGSLPRP